MPEGPECRRYAEDLAKRVSGKVLIGIDMVGGRYTKKPPTGIDSFLSGLPVGVIGAGVHGKFIYWILKNDFFIWSTLGMTGQWSSEDDKHTRVRFNLDDGAVYYNDQRNFGTLKFVRGKFQMIEKLKSFGPDMLAGDIQDDVFIKQLRLHPKWEITKALMDQSVIAGVGNYVKSDSLWLAGLSPKRVVEDLSDLELSALNRSVKHIVRESYRSSGAKTGAYKNFAGQSDDHGYKFLVYNQNTDPDGNEVIREMTLDKRTTHWVPEVQS
jgi:DNA-formamidopyrimidine glycosylase